MAWSIYKNSSYSFNEWERCYTAWFVDYDMDTKHFPNKVKFLHDGWYDVYFDNDYVTCKVTNGEWDRDVHDKIITMVHRTYHGDFIEGFEKRDGRINVLIGS